MLVGDKSDLCSMLKEQILNSVFFPEQQYFEVEKRLAQSQERLVTETQECQNLQQELNKLSKYII